MNCGSYEINSMTHCTPSPPLQGWSCDPGLCPSVHCILVIGAEWSCGPIRPYNSFFLWTSGNMTPIFTQWPWNLRQLWGLGQLLSHVAETGVYTKEGRSKAWTVTKSQWYHMSPKSSQAWSKLNSGLFSPSQLLHFFLFSKKHIDFKNQKHFCQVFCHF